MWQGHLPDATLIARPLAWTKELIVSLRLAAAPVSAEEERTDRATMNGGVLVMLRQSGIDHRQPGPGFGLAFLPRKGLHLPS